MSMAETLVPTRTAPPQGAARDTRVKDDGSAGAAAGADEETFGGVMSDLAEAKRGGASEKSGDAERSGTGSQPGSKATQSGPGDANSETPIGEGSAQVDEAYSSVQSGSLLAQVALVLGTAANNAQPAADGEFSVDMLLGAASGDEKGTLKTAWELASALAKASDGGSDLGLPGESATPNALAALSDGVEEAAFANLVAPTTPRGEGSASDASLPAIKVTVTGQETHFAPVQSAESALNRLLNAAAVAADGTVAAGTDSTASAEGEDASAKSSGVTALAGAEASIPMGGLESAPQSGGGREGSGSEKRSGDGQTAAASADLQGGRSGAISATAFEIAATGNSVGTTSDASPGAQIAKRIAAELANPASRPAPVQASSSDGAAKVLHIQLEPANLGSVTVRIALKDNVINLHVEASRHETAFAIEKDRELLSNALKSAGYIVDGISSQPADPARPSLQAQAVSNDGQMSSSLQSQSDSQSGLAQSGRGNRGEEGRQFADNGFAPASQVNERSGDGSRASGGALYV